LVKEKAKPAPTKTENKPHLIGGNRVPKGVGDR